MSLRPDLRPTPPSMCTPSIVAEPWEQGQEADIVEVRELTTASSQLAGNAEVMANIFCLMALDDVDDDLFWNILWTCKNFDRWARPMYKARCERRDSKAVYFQEQDETTPPQHTEASGKVGQPRILTGQRAAYEHMILAQTCRQCWTHSSPSSARAPCLAHRIGTRARPGTISSMVNTRW